MLRKLSSRMSQERLKLFASGLFYSKLSYCFSVFWNVFGLEKYKEVNKKYKSFTASDNNKLQVQKNTLIRMLTAAVYNTTTSDLLEQTDSISVQQMIAFQTMVMTYKIIRSRKTTYLAEKMKFRERRKIRKCSATKPFPINKKKKDLSIEV